MKNNVKWILSFIIVLAVVFCVYSIPMNTELNADNIISTQYLFRDNITTFSAGNGKYFFVSCDKSSGKSLISCFDANTKTFTDYVDIPYLYDCCCCNGSSLYLVSNDATNNCIGIKEYFISKDCKFSSNAIVKLNRKNLLNASSFTVDANGNMYFVNVADNSTINVMPADGSGIFKIGEGQGPFLSLKVNPAGNMLYATTSSNVSVLFDLNDNYESTVISADEIILSNYKFINDNTIVGGYNGIYRMNAEGNACTLLFNTEINLSGAMACEFAGEILTAESNNKLKLYNNQNKAYKQAQLSGQVISLCSDDSTAIAITDVEGTKYIKLIEIDGFTAIEDSTPEASDQETKPETQGEADVTSSIYKINNEDGMISGVELGTTIATFKSNINYSGYSLSFKNYADKNLTSGKLGTGATVTFLRDGGSSKTFTFIVKGDLTGEGNSNSRDLSLMVNYLLGESSLDGVYLKAIDINGDGVVDTIDLLLLEKMVNNS